MCKKVVIITSKKISKIIFRKVNELNRPFRSQNTIFSIQTKFELTYFDFAVLCALHTLYEAYGETVFIKPVHILKIITANEKAHFSTNTKKSRTITESMILNSIHVLEQFEIELGKKTYPLIKLDVRDGYFIFKDTPYLVSSYNSNNYLELKKMILDIDVLKFQLKYNYIHQNADIVIFKFWILNSAILTDEFISIELIHIFKILNVLKSINSLNKQFKEHKISYEIFRKRKNKLMIRVKKILVSSYLDTLLAKKIISSYHIDQFKLEIKK